jgi:hypothetical protein
MMASMTSGRRSKADRKAQITGAWSKATADKQIKNFGPIGDLPGCSGFGVGGKGGALIVLPTLREDAPEDVQLAYYGRVIANGTGRCPRCAAVASVETGQMSHENECEVGSFEDLADKWCDPIGLATAEAIARGR